MNIPTIEELAALMIAVTARTGSPQHLKNLHTDLVDYLGADEADYLWSLARRRADHLAVLAEYRSRITGTIEKARDLIAKLAEDVEHQRRLGDEPFTLPAGQDMASHIQDACRSLDSLTALLDSISVLSKG